MRKKVVIRWKKAVVRVRKNKKRRRKGVDHTEIIGKFEKHLCGRSEDYSARKRYKEDGLGYV